jgi:hypothetical protein
MRAVERAARAVYGEPPPDWARYYPSPATPVSGIHATEIVLAAGSVAHYPAESEDPIAGAIGGKEHLVPRIRLRTSFEYRSGTLRVGHVSRPAEQWTAAEFEDALLDQLHEAIGREPE